MSAWHPVLAIGALSVSIACMALPPSAPSRANMASLAGPHHEYAQVILFDSQIRDGRRIDRDDPYLPRLDAEASEARRLNYEFCTVAMEQRLATGQVRALRMDEPRTLFALVVDGQRWREDPDDIVLDEAACMFTAGDSRRRIQFPVYDERGQLLGRWRWSRFVAE